MALADRQRPEPEGVELSAGAENSQKKEGGSGELIPSTFSNHRVWRLVVS
jgi:hypothetical protein